MVIIVINIYIHNPELAAADDEGITPPYYEA
jgi:hypothetical protein